jgi:hypothetical protein
VSDRRPPSLLLDRLPPELQAALALAWPGCPEAQRRALLAPLSLGGEPLWPGQLWPWQPHARWWRLRSARECRAGTLAYFVARVSDALGAPRGPRLFDPAQPFFATPWTQASELLHSPAPDAFSDADFWYITQRLCGGQRMHATRLAEDWATGMRRDRALQGPRRHAWLNDALHRLEASARGDFL